MTGRTVIVDRKLAKALLPMDECIETQERVFELNGLGRAWNGPSAWINYPDPHPTTVPYRGRMMAGGIEPDWRGTKQIHYAIGVIRSQIICLFAAKDVLPLGIVEAQYVGQCRTGAGAGVATRHLARKDAKVVGVVGTGETARFSLLALRAIAWPVSTVYVYSRSKENRDRYAVSMRKETGFAVEPVDDIETTVRRAEILIVGTSSREPVVKADWVRPGTLVNAMGQAEEIDPQLFLRARVIADEARVALEDGHVHACIKTGQVTPAVVQASLGEVVAAKKSGRTRDDEILLFDSSGLCIQDMAAAIHVVEKAKERGLGDRVDFGHDAPMW